MAKKGEEKKEPKKEPKAEETSAQEPEKKEEPDRLAELEKKLGEHSEYIGKTKEFVEGASVVINTIAGSPELTKAFQQEVQKKYNLGAVPAQQAPQGGSQEQPPAQSPNETKQIDDRVTGVETSQREQVIRNFESSHGIDSLGSEERSKVRKGITTYLADFGLKIDTIPLPLLQNNLEKAFVGTHAEKLREEGKLEGMTKARELQNATIGTMGGTTPTPSEEKGLSPAQKEWAKRLGVEEEGAAKLYIAQDEDKDRVPPAEKEAKK